MKEKNDLLNFISEKKTLGEKVYDILKKSIINKKIKPETRMTETGIAKKLGVSATPVREAFRRLESEGLIEASSWRGVIVKEITDKDIEDIYECRKILEGRAAELAAENINIQEIKVLKKILKDSKKCDNYEEIFKLNSEFHKTILKISKNKRLEKLLEEIMIFVVEDRKITLNYKKRTLEIIKEHKEILNALENKDSKKAGDLTREHIDRGLNFIKKIKS